MTVRSPKVNPVAEAHENPGAGWLTIRNRPAWEEERGDENQKKATLPSFESSIITLRCVSKLAMSCLQLLRNQKTAVAAQKVSDIADKMVSEWRCTAASYRHQPIYRSDRSRPASSKSAMHLERLGKASYWTPSPGRCL